MFLPLCVMKRAAVMMTVCFWGALPMFPKILILGRTPAFSLVMQQLDIDALFRKAQQLGRESQFEAAAEICRSILKTTPQYHDVRVYLARLRLWQQAYASAREELHKVLEMVPAHADALNALIDTELWTAHPADALRVCETALDFYPDNEEFLLKKARVLFLQKEYVGSGAALDRILEINPAHTEARQMGRQLQYVSRAWEFGQNYRMDVLDRNEPDPSPWQFFSLDATYVAGWGTLTGRINYADRDYGAGGIQGMQFELESYPKFNERFYAYVNAGYSSAQVFPRYRLGGELYTNLPESWEASAGLRYLEFSKSPALLFTGSLGKYINNYWISIRPTISSESGGSAFSGLLWVRKYFRTADEFMGVLVGVGTAPMDLNFVEDILRSSSYRLGLEIKKPLSRVLFIRGHIRFEREEYFPETWGNRFVIDLRLEERLFRKY